ncbi:MAG: hypothetical protein R2824_29975 [Saprospiraceae bacterium]|nr:hypothetical protein [Lewinella sp.]
MRNFLKPGSLLLIFLFLGVLNLSAQMEAPPFWGEWRGVSPDNRDIRIEFSSKGEYRLTIGEQKLFSPGKCWGKAKYEWGKEEDHYKVTVFGEDEPDIASHLQLSFSQEGLLKVQLFSDSGEPMSSITLQKI